MQTMSGYEDDPYLNYRVRYRSLMLAIACAMRNSLKFGGRHV